MFMELRGWSVQLGSLPSTWLPNTPKRVSDAAQASTAQKLGAGVGPWPHQPGASQLKNASPKQAQRIPVRLHLSFFAVVMMLSLLGLTGSESWQDDLFFTLVYLSSLFVSGLVQLQLRSSRDTGAHQGIGPKLLLSPVGSLISITSTSANYRQSLPSLVRAGLAGAFVYFLIALLLLITTDIRLQLDQGLWRPQLFCAAFVTALGLLNLIPLPPFLGSQIAAALLTLQGRVSSFQAAEMLLGEQSRRFGLLTLIAAIGLTLLGVVSPSLGLLVLLMAGVLLSAGAALALRRRLFTVAYTRRVRDVMFPRHELTCLKFGSTVQSVIGIVLRSAQRYLPVFLGRELRGFVNRDELIEVAATGNPAESYLSHFVQRELFVTTGDTPLSEVLGMVLEHDDKPIVVLTADGDFEGLLLRDTVTEVLLIEGFLQERPPSLNSPEDELL